MVALPLKKSVFDLAREPIWVATALSIGLHGLFWLASPVLIPTAPANVQNKRSVRVVQLSPVGQTRLPATLSSTEPASTNVPSVPPLPNTAFSQFPGGQLFNSPSVPLMNAPMYQLPDVPPPPPVSSAMPNLPALPPPIRTEPRREPTPEVTPSVPPRATELTPTARSTTEPSTTDPNTPTASPSPESSPIAAATPPPVGTSTGTSTPRGMRSLSGSTAPDAEYAYSAEGTGAIDGTEQLIIWLQKARQIAGDPGLQPQKLQEPLVIREYPLKRCLANPKPAAVAVLVDPNGKVADAPKLLTSSGYGVLNRVAMDTLRSRDFPKSEASKYTIYTFNVDFQLQNPSCPPDAASATSP